MYCRRIKRVFAFLAALLIIAIPSAVSPALKVGADTLEQMQDKSRKLEKEAKALQAQINKHEKNLNDQKAYKNTLDKKINNTSAQIDLLIEQIDAANSEIRNLNSKIAQKETEIAEKESEIDEQFEALRLRLRAISKSGNLSVVQMLMDTDNYTDYLIKSKMMERVAINDKNLMERLNEEIEKINAEKDLVEADKKQAEGTRRNVESLKKQSEAQKAELDVLYKKANVALKNIQSSVKNYEQKLILTKKEQEELDREIRRIINQNSGNGNYIRGSMFWPVPAVRAVSSHYGMRSSGFHGGIDIANGPIPVYGQNIVAAASGTVIYVNKTDSWGGSYGYYLIIDHGIDSKGKRISTLYAHCSKIYAYVGQKVVGGETVVALVGRTGNVTGPHLHFEVREDGARVSPIGKGYVKY